MFNKFNPLAFIQNIDYLLVGMISIFIVMGVIILSTVILNKIFSDKKDK
ncbi:MAG: oxaloacetate decarboxylase [Clostridia bacterium]|nr:oxaloacetate decarboxylase [Clostridia bacterium]